MRKKNDLRRKRYDKMYCKILSNNVKEAKLNNYNNQILEPNNKTLWKIVKLESGKQYINEEM
jgi:hypothetical protein